MDAFVPKMVWRETRAVWRRLFFFYICVAIGVGAIVAIRSIIQNVRVTLVAEARTIFGADVAVSTNRPWRPDTTRRVEEFLKATQGVHWTHVVETSTMVRPERADRPGARMVELKGVRPGYPFYGQLELESRRPYSHEMLGDDGIIVQRDLLLQLGLDVGDRLVIGGTPFTIRDVIAREPGRQVSTFTLGSRVFLDLEAMNRLNLLGFGSRAFYRILVRTDRGLDAGLQLTRRLQRTIRDEFVSVRHYRGTEAGINQDLVRAEDYLSLVGFVIVVLGGIGVWSVTRVFMQQKIRSIAILKCLGASSKQVLGTYVSQMSLLAAAGGITGVAIAAVALLAIPESLVSLLPSGRPTVTWSAALQGIAVGLLVSVLFALVPLLETRAIKPLLLLRADTATSARKRDWVAILSYIVVAAGLAGVAAWQAGSLRASLYVMGGLAGVGIVLHVASWLLVKLVRPLTRSRIFAVRHAIISLGRPGNQTRVVLLTVGLGAFFIVAIQHVQANLLNAFSLELTGDSPDMFLIDIQPDQEQGVQALLNPRLPEPAKIIPVLRARVASVAGSVNLDDVDDVRRRGIGREYVITYRSHLEANEVLQSGRLWDSPVPEGGELEVSIESSIAQRGISIGDRMRFDIAGRVVEARVTSIRDVDWSEARNGGFMFVFRPGRFEDAPRTSIALLKAPRQPEARATLQRDLVASFPNVSAIDVREIIRTIQGVVQNITLAITIVGLIALGSGMLILIGAVAMTRFQRHYEAAIYRTLGASTRRITAMVAVEYGVLGTLAGILGATGALALSWAVTTRLLEMEWELTPRIAGIGIAATAAVVLIVGLVASLDVIVKKPLGSLRGQ